jgi:hypothetical protein
MNIPKNAKTIEVDNSTVPFYQDENGYYFDSSSTAVPEPMINAVAGLQLLDENKKLIMINHKIPMGLFPKIEAYFDYEVEELKDGNVKITFSKKEKLVPKLDFDTNCSG